MKVPAFLLQYVQDRGEKQIPPLRFGMTSKNVWLQHEYREQQRAK
jgi:hypothetical protein